MWFVFALLSAIFAALTSMMRETISKDIKSPGISTQTRV